MTHSKKSLGKNPLGKNALAKKLLAAAVALAWTGPLAADDHDSDATQKLAIHHVKVKVGHGPAFGEGMAAYAKCLAESDYDGSYSVWSAVDGDRTAYHVVSSFDLWGEMDEDDPVSDACWEKEGMREGIFEHLVSWKTHYAEHMPDWSGDMEGSTVVRLHYFRVDDGEDFRETVGTITGHLKEAEYENMGTWYDVQPTGYGAADYFYVDHFEDFAAMDGDRMTVDSTLREAIGDEDTEEIWEEFGDSLEDEKGYWAVLLQRQDDMSYSSDDD